MARNPKRLTPAAAARWADEQIARLVEEFSIAPPEENISDDPAVYAERPRRRRKGLEIDLGRNA